MRRQYARRAGCRSSMGARARSGGGRSGRGRAGGRAGGAACAGGGVPAPGGARAQARRGHRLRAAAERAGPAGAGCAEQAARGRAACTGASACLARGLRLQLRAPWQRGAPPRAPACRSAPCFPQSPPRLAGCRPGARAERAPTCCPGSLDRRPRRPRGKRALRPARPPRPHSARRQRQQRRRLPRCLRPPRPYRPASCGASSAARGAGAGRGPRHCSEVSWLCSCGLGAACVRGAEYVSSVTRLCQDVLQAVCPSIPAHAITCPERVLPLALDCYQCPACSPRVRPLRLYSCHPRPSSLQMLCRTRPQTCVSASDTSSTRAMTTKCCTLLVGLLSRGPLVYSPSCEGSCILTCPVGGGDQ